MVPSDKRQFLRQYQPGVMLAEGEENRVHRIRASAEVHEWLSGLTAAQRGELMRIAYEAAHASDVTPDADDELGEQHPVLIQSDVTPVRRARRSMKVGGVPRTSSERIALSVPYLNVMERPMKRGLGWKPERYDRVDRMLNEGDTLTADGVNYRTATGTLMDYRTAEALLRLGVLAPA